MTDQSTMPHQTPSPNTNVVQTTAPSNSFLADLMALLERHPAVSKALMIIFSAIGGAVLSLSATYKFIEQQVQSQAEVKLAPYEKLFSAQSLISSSEYDLAAQELHELVREKVIEKFPEKMQITIYDNLLFAIVNADNYSGYEPDIYKIQAKFRENAPSTGWRSQQLGWYFMRLGVYDTATEYFIKSKAAFDSESDYLSSVDPLRGLLTIAIVQGKMNDAKDTSEKIIAINSMTYRSYDDLIADVKQIPSNKYFLNIRSREREAFDINLIAYMKLLKDPNNRLTKTSR
jgi:hypothetical protein